MSIAALCMISGCTSSNENKSSENNAIDSVNFDMTVSPGKDFYNYANGSWLQKNQIPGEYSSYGIFEILYEDNLKDLRAIMETAAKNTTAANGSEQQKIGDFFTSGMDTATIEKVGVAPIKADLDKINSIKTSKDIPALLGYLHYINVDALFRFSASADEKNSEMVIAIASQGGLGLPERDYYVNTDQQSIMLRSMYQKHIENMFKLIGKNQAEAVKIAENILKFETQLAEASKTMVDLRDPIANYNKFKVDALQKISPDFDWNVYMKEMGIDPSCDINVGQPKFFETVNIMLKKSSTEQWKEYLTWHLVNSMANYLSKAFVDESFNFYGKVLSGRTEQSDRWKKIVKSTSGSLGEIVGKVYVEKRFSPQAKTRMLDLVSNLKKSLAQRIKQLAWMNAETKKKAAEKLDVMGLKIGYPDKWRDYSKLQITKESYYNNILNCIKFETGFSFSKIGKPVDKAEWEMTPQTINAYYSPNKNEIVFPAAILQAPIFFLDADDAVNYGAIGVIIGHEMTHGFDDQGRLYDKSGNLNDWWVAEDAIKFKETTSVLVTQFNKFKLLDSLHVNGEVTLGENIADLGGLTISYNAFKIANKETGKINGFTPDQRFFFSYAQVWRSNFRPEYLQMLIKVDVHSPAIARVNGVVYNVPEFYTAFDIKEKDSMYRKVEDRPVIW